MLIRENDDNNLGEAATCSAVTVSALSTTENSKYLASRQIREG